MTNEIDIAGGTGSGLTPGTPEYEIRYLAGKLGVSERLVIEAIEKVGKDRADIEAYISKIKKGDAK